jgi:copper homeostasis protein
MKNEKTGEKNMNEPLIEGCVDSYASCAAAVRAGADRLELCGQLIIGGVTPSPVLFRQVRRDFGVKINVLIRPRFGDFLYSKEEIGQMCGEIEMFRELGADGAVIGALTPEGELDREKMSELMSCAGGMDVTLHRAFDMTREPMEALEAAVDLGCRTILTSGQENSAEAGKALLRSLRERAEGRIDVMAGSGVNSRNIRALYDFTGIRVFHTSGRRGAIEGGMVYRKDGVNMGLAGLSEYELRRTDEDEFRECAQIVHSLQ